MGKENKRRRRWIWLAAAVALIVVCVLIYADGGAATSVVEVPGGFQLRIGVLERSGAVTIYDLSDEAQIKAVQDDIRAQRSERLRDQSALRPDYPFLSLSDGEGPSARRAVWSNGVWLDGMGKTYQISLDLQEILALAPDAALRQASLADFPGRFAAASFARKWDTRLLEPAAPPPNTEELITRAGERLDDKLSVTVYNPNEYPVSCYPGVLLDVLLDGEWYAVPTADGAEAAPEEIPLEPESSAVVSASTSEAEARYGKLPAGHYRVVLLTYSSEFDVT